MEYKFYRDLKHSYMVCNCGGNQENKDANYQLKILESGRIKGLLKCNLRSINQENFLYYDISSMVNIADRYAAKGLDHEQLLGLLGNMKEMIEGLSEFLMGDEGIVLNTRNVFVNLSTGEFSFMYYPYLTDNTSFEEFAESLLDIVDHDDEKAVEIIYELCDMVHIKELMILDVLNQLLQKHLENASDDNVEKEKAITYNEDYSYEDIYEDEVCQDIENTDETRMERSKRTLSGKVQILFSFMFMAVIAGIVYIRMNYILTREENLLSIGIMLISGITGAIALIGGIRTMKKKAAVKEETQKQSVSFVDEYENNDDYEDIDSYKSPLKVTPSYTEPKQKADDYLYEDLGETMVLDEEQDKVLTLYSRNPGKTIRISLGNLPITIGKMEGCVDEVISDSSISRMHCKIVKDQIGIALIDLGSTNGCYHNGLRISPQKKTYIEEGDEVKLGRICFDLR